jgi:DNA-binding IscR family transcriptional regulator
MLLNQESMHLERIHVMLKMLSQGASDGKVGRFDLNLVQLKRYLQTLVQQDVLEIVEGGGSYRLRR